MTHRIVPVVAAFAVLASASAPAQAPNAPLQERTKQFIAAANANDAAKLASCYVEDAVWMPPNGPRVKGRTAIEARARELFKESPGAELELSPLASQVSGDLGYIQGEFVTTSRGAGGQAVRERGNYVWILQRVGGEWKISQDIYNGSEPPPPPPPAPKAPKPPKPPTPPQK